MIKQYLDSSNEILDKLITLTDEDIQNIKQANHDSVPKSVESKNKLIAEFYVVKKNLDNALIQLSEGGKKDLSVLLDDLDKEKLGEFKKRLKELHKKNKEYAKLVIVVKNYFDGLLNTMFDSESGTNNAYSQRQTDVQSLFKMNV